MNTPPNHIITVAVLHVIFRKQTEDHLLAQAERMQLDPIKLAPWVSAIKQNNVSAVLARSAAILQNCHAEDSLVPIQILVWFLTDQGFGVYCASRLAGTIQTVAGFAFQTGILNGRDTSQEYAKYFVANYMGTHIDGAFAR